MVSKKALSRQINTKRLLRNRKKHKINRNICDVRVGLGTKQGVPNTIMTKFVDFFRGSITNFEQQLVPRFDNASRKRKLVACLVGQLTTKLEAKATTIRITWCLEEPFNREVTLSWSMLYTKTRSARNRRWTNDDRTSIRNRRSYGKCQRALASGVDSF